ncbi:hypothetical protein PMZ80_002058 [Knufia obscura]|uniref:Amidase domain-containing protein n=2 Tax=Knufia TaxID=430999 RepID=A0AAN8EL58_9EURO|nr:hypothetical protein PMZ80_002058 [Knufia obscura]KAK5953873.1 hypothetical protein OHC33_005144 [Knufia fluminis]
MASYKSALAATALLSLTLAAPLKRSQAVQPVTSIKYGDLVFDLGDITYLASVSKPVTTVNGISGEPGFAPVTVLKVDGCTIDASTISSTIDSYHTGDDVFSESFLHGTFISSTCAGTAQLGADASSYLSGINSTLLDHGLPSTVEPGPYLASIASDGSISLSKVYRLYQDRYRDFVFGTYPAPEVGTYQALPNLLTEFQDLLIPVPSRIYSWSDPRPLAGVRVAVKDLYDLAGTQTSAGSRAWAEITPIANETAPSIQQIIDLGGIIVGKQKTAQFASGADPWDWYDVQYPFNPRGDEWLTCSASSAGAGCSIAAYNWLDHAIGSDTGSSVRRPAAVSGTYGNRPSQGMISLVGVNPLGAAQDTAGVFARDPLVWSHFAKNWYRPDMHQDPSTNGLEPLSIVDSYDLPTTIYYDPDYLPVRNPAANALIKQFYSDLNTALNITTITTNITNILLTHPDPAVTNTTYRNNASSLLNTRTQWLEVAEPLLTAWSSKYAGRFPPIDPARRPGWITRTPENYTQAQYDNALAIKRNFSSWMNHDFLGNGNPTMGSCADSSLWIYDIGTGGLPSYREEDLLDRNNVTTARLSYTPPGVLTSGVNFCSFAGCADYTIPIGQVGYFSNVTQVVEMVPVTVSVVAKRGCDFVLFNVVERLAEVGILKTVKTGRMAF